MLRTNRRAVGGSHRAWSCKRVFGSISSPESTKIGPGGLRCTLGGTRGPLGWAGGWFKRSGGHFREVSEGPGMPQERVRHAPGWVRSGPGLFRDPPKSSLARPEVTRECFLKACVAGCLPYTEVVRKFDDFLPIFGRFLNSFWIKNR